MAQTAASPAMTAARKYFASSRSGDVARWVAPLAVDVVVRDPVTAVPITGRAGMLAYLRNTLTAFDRFDGLMEEELFAAGDFAAAVWRAEGVVKGRSVSWRGINTFTVNQAGEIQTMDAYFDDDALAAALTDSGSKT